MSQRLASKLKNVGTQCAVSEPSTHEIVHGQASSRWQISRPSYGAFLKDYCSHIASYELTEEDEEYPGLAEVPSSLIPFIVDLRLSFESAHYDEPFDDKFLYTFVYTLQQVMVSNLQISYDSQELVCFVMESESYPDDKTTRIDMRFQFPMCKIEASVFKTVLIPSLIRRLRTVNMTAEFFHQPIGDWDSIINKNIYDKPVSMYGSTSTSIATPMVLKHVVDCVDYNDLKNCDFENMEVSLDEIDPIEHTAVSQGLIDKSIFQDTPNNEFWLPVILSVDYCNKVTLQKVTSRTTPMSGGVAVPGTSNYNIDKFGVEDWEVSPKESKYELSHILIKGWDVKRILKKEYWKSIGEAFYDATYGEEAGYDSWVEITRSAVNSIAYDKVPDFLKYDGIVNVEACCEDLYSTFKCDNVTVKTIAQHALEDNPRMYNDWHKSWYMKPLEIAIERQTDVAIANAFVRMYWLTIICVHRGNKKIWYMFERHRWREIAGGHAIRMLLTEDFTKKLRILRNDLYKQAEKSVRPDDVKKTEEIGKKIMRLIDSLENARNLSGIMTMIADRMVHETFEELLDENPEILGLTNGVLNATSTGIEFRAGRPEDYVSMSTNVALRNDYHWEHPHVKKVLKWMHEMFPDPQLYHHFMKWCASTLCGGNKDKKLVCMSGEGDNGKSMLVQLFEAVFGPYCIKMPAGVARKGGRGSSDGPNPSIARAKSRRLCFMEEPPADAAYDSDLFKHLTGSDRFFARLLKKNGGDIKPLFKLVMMCNKIPRIPKEKAMENRFQIYACLGLWVADIQAAVAKWVAENPGKTEMPNFYVMDTSFQTQIPGMAAAALWIWTNTYPLYVAEGLKDVPDIIKRKTQEYWEDNDVYFQFVADQIEVAKLPDGQQNINSKIDVNSLYSSFRMWHKTSFERSKVPDKITFKKDMISKWGMPVDGYWSGIAFKAHTSQQSGSMGMGCGMGGLMGGITARPTGMAY